MSTGLANGAPRVSSGPVWRWRLCRRGHDNRSRSVVETGRISSGYDVLVDPLGRVPLERRPELCQRLERAVGARALVGVHDPRFAVGSSVIAKERRSNRKNLVLETPLGPGTRRASSSGEPMRLMTSCRDMPGRSCSTMLLVTRLPCARSRLYTLK